MIEFHETTMRCERCDACAWEAIETRMVRERGRQVLHDVLECAFCGARVFVLAPAKPKAERKPEAGSEFRFQFGRFQGMTFAEADAEPNGRKYLELMRDNNERLRDRISEYLSHAAPSAEAALDSKPQWPPNRERRVSTESL